MDNPKLARTLILDERFDLALYERLLPFVSDDLKNLLSQLIPIERKHVVFWEDFFKVSYPRLNPARRIKLFFILLCARIFGEWFVYLVLEAIEVYGIRKYLAVWHSHKDTALADALQIILRDELEHEDEIVSRTARPSAAPAIVRDILLGFNDGLVEILGAISGFFAAFQELTLVFLAGLTVAVAGSISMAASAFAAASSENEVRQGEIEKNRFLRGEENLDVSLPHHARRTALLVGVSYFIAALIPIIPVLLGATSMVISLTIGGVISVIASLVLSFISGMNARRRIAINLLIIAIAITASYLVGLLAKELLGLAIV